jgi:hypothetical protein
MGLKNKPAGRGIRQMSATMERLAHETDTLSCENRRLRAENAILRTQLTDLHEDNVRLAFELDRLPNSSTREMVYDHSQFHVQVHEFSRFCRC